MRNQTTAGTSAIGVAAILRMSLFRGEPDATSDSIIGEQPVAGVVVRRSMIGKIVAEILQQAGGNHSRPQIRVILPDERESPLPTRMERAKIRNDRRDFTDVRIATSGPLGGHSNVLQRYEALPEQHSPQIFESFLSLPRRLWEAGTLPAEMPTMTAAGESLIGPNSFAHPAEVTHG